MRIENLRLTTSGAAKLSVGFARVLTRFYNTEEGLEPENLDEAILRLVNYAEQVLATPWMVKQTEAESGEADE